MTTTARSILAFPLILAACGAPADSQAPAQTEQAESEIQGGRYTFFVASGRDFRKCMYPMCGGVFVKRVNTKSTRCVDGSYEDQCYVSDVDFSDLGLTEEQVYETTQLFNSGHVVVRGKIAKWSPEGSTAKFGVLRATEAWVANVDTDSNGSIEGNSLPDGKFYRVKDQNIVCITTPCPTMYKQEKLNSSKKPYTLSDLDLAATGASEEEVDAALLAAKDDGILIASEYWDGTVYVNEFYTLVKPEEATCEPNHNLNYVGSSPEKCQLVKFFCQEGTTSFFNDCGCGCEQPSYCPEFINCMPGPGKTNCGMQAECPFSQVAW